jgi:hypothetical protein
MEARREELEAALVQAERAREELEAFLEEAKAALVTTVTDASKIDANRADAEAKVEKARARCRQLRSALADPGQLEFITRSRERLDALIWQSGEPPRDASAANPLSKQARPRAPRGESEGSRLGRAWKKQANLSRTALAISPHMRGTVGLLALVLAYLQYYFLDVQFQILVLPSVINTFVLQK